MELKARKNRRGIITESISVQHDGFGERLEAQISFIVEEIKKVDGRAVDLNDSHPVIVKIQNMVFDRFGMKIDLITDSHLAATLPFYSNRNHIFLPDFIRGNLNIREQTKLLKTFENKSGFVNLEKATVGGIFSEYEHPVFMNFVELVRSHDFTVPEITACLLHELGHDFNACYYSDRSDRTNQVLANIARNLMNSEKGDIDYIFKELQQITPSATKEAVDKMVNGSRVVAGMTWFKTIIGVVKSQLDDDTYSDTSFEQKADNFATRFGYGKALLTSLDKLHKYSPEKSKAMLVIIQLVGSVGTIALSISVLSLLGAGSLGLALALCFFNFIILTLSREDVVDYTYDKLKQRYIRVRLDAIDQLKSPRLKKDQIRATLDSIYAMDEVIKETANLKLLPAYISNFIFSGARKADNSITDQQLMEALASNDLFVQAAELRLKA